MKILHNQVLKRRQGRCQRPQKMENKANHHGVMPVLFVGHGSPMNAIEDNRFTQGWATIAERIGKPKAILSVSAHWYTNGMRIQNAEKSKMVYDMYGFPHELYEVVYPAKGSPEFAQKTRELLGGKPEIDNSWGLDHGTWSVLGRMYPKADVPVFQLSIDANLDAEKHFEKGKQLRTLREEGVLVFGSGNVVHNLSMINWDMDGGYSWAEEFDGYIKNSILTKDFQKAVKYEQAGESAKLAFRTQEHYYPLMYVLGAADESDGVSVYNDSCVLGSLSMTSYLIG